MNTYPSKPFEADSTTPDLIQEGVRRLRAQHRTNADAHRAAFEQQVSAAFERHEADRRQQWIDEYRQDHFVALRYPYESYTPAEQYRVSLPKDTRIEGLAAAGLYDQVLYCFLARAGRSATVKQVQEWFAPYMPVAGDTRIEETMGQGHSANTVVHASGLSTGLADLLTKTWLVDVELGKVKWMDREHDPSEY
jgi:hypothetical protein